MKVYRFLEAFMDHHQLPPVQDGSSNELIKMSPLFDRKDAVVTLNEIVRQEEGNPIRKLTQATAACIDGNQDLKALLKTFKGDFSEELQKGVVITPNPLDVAKTYVNAFRRNVEFGYANKMAIVAYKRKTVTQLNKDIRRQLGFTKQFEKGDILITSSPYENEVTGTSVTNGEEFWVENVNPNVIDGIPCYDLECIRVDDEGTHKVSLPVIAYAGFNAYKKRKEELRLKIKDAAPKKKGFHKMNIKAFTDQFCNVGYGHATTAYKIQGSTIDTVFANVTDILGTGPLNDLQRLQSIYVALTRAKNRLVIY